MIDVIPAYSYNVDMTSTELLNNALIFAVEKHKDQKRKYSNLPYVFHPLEVAQIISTFTDNPEVIASGLLHDTIEDSNVLPEEIEKQFGKYVLELVKSETEEKHNDIPREESWKRRKEESLEMLKTGNDINVKILWLADKLSNIRSFCRLYANEGLSMWNKFNEKDPELQKWYYTEILENTKELSDTEAYQELQDRIQILFREVK